MKIAIVGAGIFGMIAALELSEVCSRVEIFESQSDVLALSSKFNQARLHRGLHYPRDLPTAIDANKSFSEFSQRFPFAVKNVTQFYVVAKDGSLVSSSQYLEFIQQAGIDVVELDSLEYVPAKNAALIVKAIESTFETDLIKQFLLNKIWETPNITLRLNTTVVKIEEISNKAKIGIVSGETFEFDRAVVCAYAHNSHLAKNIGIEWPQTRFEVCEVLLGVAPQLENQGITVMDGPFWSIMPYGFSGLHSLTHVSHTPLDGSNDELLVCQRKHRQCGVLNTFDCNHCNFLPKSNKEAIVDSVRDFTNGKLDFRYRNSTYVLKAVLNNDDKDGRPTIVRNSSMGLVKFIFSGKIGDSVTISNLI
jgi:hypothetical protein